MAGYGAAAILGRVLVLLVLIAILAIGGVFWFDYLNVIDAKNVTGPIFDVLRGVPVIGGIVPVGAGRTGPDPLDGQILDIDAERFAVLLEAYDLRARELDVRESDMRNRYGEIEQMAQELEERQKALDDQEKSFNAQRTEADIKDRNVEQSARYLTNMPPAQAVGILNAMDDQDVIDVLRMTEQIAQAEGSASLVSVWLSQMDPARAAELSRKMVSRPPGLF